MRALPAVTSSLFFLILSIMIVLRPRLLLKALRLNHHGVLYYADTKQSIVALTIDDGPDETTTKRILDILKSFNVRATFFIISEHVLGNEAILDRILAEQHEIGNHMTHNFPSILLSRREFEDRLVLADGVLREYASLNWFRPANAFYSKFMLKVVDRYGYRCVLGDLLPLDVFFKSSKIIVKYIMSTVSPGSIITLHDRGRHGQRTIEILPLLLKRLKDEGYRATTVTELSQQPPAEPEA